MQNWWSSPLRHAAVKRGEYVYDTVHIQFQGRNRNTDRRSPIVYTTSGAALFSGYCSVCRNTHTTTVTVMWSTHLTTQLLFSACTSGRSVQAEVYSEIVYSEMHEAGDRSRLGHFPLHSNDRQNWGEPELGRTTGALVEKSRTIRLFTTGNRRDVERLCQSAMRGVNSQTPTSRCRSGRESRAMLR